MRGRKGVKHAIIVSGGFSAAFSVGNEANVDIVDCMEYLGKCPNTRVIALYIEGIRRGRESLWKSHGRLSPTSPSWPSMSADLRQEDGQAFLTPRLWQDRACRTGFKGLCSVLLPERENFGQKQ